jgi:hypothetical protein
VEPWLVCRVVLYAYRRKKAFVSVRTWTALEPSSRAVLLLRGADGAVFQVGGAVRRSAAGKGHYRVELQIPWDAAVSLAAWAKKAVKEGAATVIHSYVARIKDTPLPPLKLVYDGHLTIRGTIIHKVLAASAGTYYVELIFGGASLLVPLKYYKYPREDRRAGGDAGVFNVPLGVLRTLYEWGFYDLGAGSARLRARIWAPPKPAAFR